MYFVTALYGSIQVDARTYSGSRDPLYVGVVPTPVTLVPGSAATPAGDLASVGREWNLRKETDTVYAQGERYAFAVAREDHAALTDGIRRVDPFPDIGFHRDRPPVVYLRKGLGADPLDDNALRISQVSVQLIASGDDPLAPPGPSTVILGYSYSDPGGNDYATWLSVFDGMQIWLQLTSVD